MPPEYSLLSSSKSWPYRNLRRPLSKQHPSGPCVTFHLAVLCRIIRGLLPLSTHSPETTCHELSWRRELSCICRFRSFLYTSTPFSSSLLVCSVCHSGLLVDHLVFPRSIFILDCFHLPPSLCLLTVWDSPKFLPWIHILCSSLDFH